MTQFSVLNLDSLICTRLPRSADALSLPKRNKCRRKKVAAVPVDLSARLVCHFVLVELSTNQNLTPRRRQWNTCGKINGSILYDPQVPVVCRGESSRLHDSTRRAAHLWALPLNNHVSAAMTHQDSQFPIRTNKILLVVSARAKSLFPKHSPVSPPSLLRRRAHAHYARTVVLQDDQVSQEE